MMIPMRMMIIMKQKSCQTMLTITRNNTTINLKRTWDNGRQRGKTMTVITKIIKLLYYYMYS